MADHSLDNTISKDQGSFHIDLIASPVASTFSPSEQELPLSALERNDAFFRNHGQGFPRKALKDLS
jgi:hypothetical protein